MMPRYRYRCLACGREGTEVRRMVDRDKLRLSPCCLAAVERLFISDFQITAELQRDRPENQPLRIESGSGSRKDWLDLERHYRDKADEENAEMPDPPDYVRPKGAVGKPNMGMTEKEIMECWQAAQAGPAQLERWRRDNIKMPDLPSPPPEPA